MPQISTILHDEQRNQGTYIRLYAEGIFYKAYERSAWVACRVLHPFMVKKRAMRKVGQEVVSIGFPLSRRIYPIRRSRVSGSLTRNNLKGAETPTSAPSDIGYPRGQVMAR